MDYDATKRVLAAFEREGVRYVVFGAAAINLQGLARYTEDLGVLIEPNAENVERLKTALKSVYDDPNIEEIRAEDLLGEYPAIDYVPPSGTFHIDILTRLGTMFRYDEVESERIPFEDVVATVATPRMLVRMKKGTVRPKDHADVAMLRERFGIGDD